MADKRKKPRSKRRRLVKLAIGVVVCLFVLVALLPTLVSWGIGQGFVTGAIESRINGTATIDKLSIGWLSAQNIKGLKINSDDGDTSITASVNLNRGLLSLVFGTTDYGTLQLSCDISGVRYEDGTTSFEKLLKQADKKEKPEKEPKDRSGAKDDSDRFQLEVIIDGIDLEVLDEATAESARIKQLTGSINLDPTQLSKIDISGQTFAGSTEGTFAIEGTVKSLIKPNGSFNSSGVTFRINANIDKLPVDIVDAVAGMNDRLNSITGPVVDAAFVKFEGNLTEGEISLGLRSPRVFISGGLAIKEGRLTPGPIAKGVEPEYAMDPIVITFSIEDEIVHTWFDDTMLNVLGLSDRPVLTSTGASKEGAYVRVRLKDFDIPLPTEDGLDLSGGSIDIAVDTGNLLFSMPDDSEIKTLELTDLAIHATSDNLTDSIATTINVNAKVDDNEPTTLTASITASNMLGKNGSFIFNPAGLTGKIEGREISTSFAQRYFKDTDVVLARDIGPTVDFATTFSEGDRKEIVTTFNADNLNGEIKALVSAAGSSDETLDINGKIVVGTGTIEIQESITGLVDEAGNFDVMNAVPVGLISVEGITPEFISLFMPDLEDIAGEGLQGNLKLNIETSGNADALTVLTNLESKGLNGKITARKTAQSIELESAKITAALTPELMRVLQKDSESPVLVTAEAAVIQFKSTVLAKHDGSAYAFGDINIEGTLKIKIALVENGPVVPQPYFVSNVDATITASINETVEYEVKGTTILLAKDTNEAFSNLEFSLKQTSEAGKSKSIGQLNFTNLAVRTLERVWEKEVGTLANWIGDDGDLFLESIALEKTSNARIDAAFPYFNGKFAVKQSRTQIDITVDAPTLIVRKDALEKLLNPVVEEGEENATKQPRIIVVSDIPLTVEAKSLIIPAALLSGGKLAADSTDLDFTLTAKSPIILKLKGTKGGDPQTVIFSRMNLGLISSDLNEGITLALKGMLKATETVEEEQQTSKSKIEATTTISKLVNERSKISIKNAALDMDIKFNDIPTWVLDAFAGRNSFLSDALGERVSAKVSSKAFSSNSGRLNATLTSENKSKVSVKLSGRKGLLRTRKDESATAALTLNKELRDRVLYKIHPIFADIRSMTNQIRINIKDARFSPENDLTKLDADIIIKTGEIELDPGSQLLGVLQLGKTRNMDTLPGHIGPLNIKIRKGIAKYNDFVIQMGGTHGNYKHRLVFTGDIDLVKQHVNEVVGEYPIASAKKSIDELKLLPGNLTFGMKYSGDLYDKKGNPKALKSEMIIDFKPEDFFKKGLGDLINDLRDGGG